MTFPLGFLDPSFGVRIIAVPELEGATTKEGKPMRWRWVDEWTIACSPSFFEELKV